MLYETKSKLGTVTRVCIWKVRWLKLITYHIDKDLFHKSTGVDFASNKGKHFRKLAVNGLRALQADIVEQSYPHKTLAHRLKGIVSACGLVEPTLICNKIEQYDGVISENKSRSIILDITLNAICCLSN